MTDLGKRYDALSFEDKMLFNVRLAAKVLKLAQGKQADSVSKFDLLNLALYELINIKERK